MYSVLVRQPLIERAGAVYSGQLNSGSSARKDSESRV